MAVPKLWWVAESPEELCENTRTLAQSYFSKLRLLCSLLALQVILILGTAALLSVHGIMLCVRIRKDVKIMKL